MQQVFHSSELKRDHEFFHTLQRYAERLNQQKNLSLSYLQTIEKLSSQLIEKQNFIQRLLSENKDLKQKLSIYQQVMTRSRIMINGNNMPEHQTPNRMKTSYNNLNKKQTFQNPQDSLRKHSPISLIKNYSNKKFTELIEKEKLTESFVQTRNQLQYLKEYDQEAYEKLQRKLNFEAPKNPINKPSFVDPPIQEQNLQTQESNKFRTLPIFDDFVILKPSQNTKISPENLQYINLVFSSTNKPVKKGDKLFQSISTYLCHNKGESWTPKEYQTQSLITKSSTSTSSNKSQSNLVSIMTNNPVLQSEQTASNDCLFIYLSNSEQTLQPIVYSGNRNDPISSIYLSFNPSLYYFGICYKSHCLQYIEGKLYKVPLLYCFITRYPFLDYWRSLLEHIVEKLNYKNNYDLEIFRRELNSIKAKSNDQKEGIFANNLNSLLTFEFELLQKKFKWKKIILQQTTSRNPDVSERHSPRSITINSPQQYKTHSLPNILQSGKLFPNSSLQNMLPTIILSEITSVFAFYSIELIIDVLLLLLLEIPIAIVSKNSQLLQKFMLYFVYILKPFKYPFPIIFELPPNMSVVLQSPFPSFIGVNDEKIIEPYIFERTVFDLDEKIAKSWPNIQFYNQSRECVVKWFNKLQGNEESEIVRLQRVNQIVKILTKSSKQYPEELKQLRTYRKYFKKTEIWHLFNHSQEQKKHKSSKSTQSIM